MEPQTSGLPEGFVERQRTRLEALRAQLNGRVDSTERQERESLEVPARDPRDEVDEGDDRAQRFIDQSLHDIDDRRIAQIERALEKIDEGSYGLSDESGEPIPRERLEAVPEANCTLEEAARREHPVNRRPAGR